MHFVCKRHDEERTRASEAGEPSKLSTTAFSHWSAILIDPAISRAIIAAMIPAQRYPAGPDPTAQLYRR